MIQKKLYNMSILLHAVQRLNVPVAMVLDSVKSFKVHPKIPLQLSLAMARHEDHLGPNRQEGQW